MNKKTIELNKENNILDDKIFEVNQEAFTNMICYLRGSDLSDYDIELVRRDLTEMVISAQERGETIDDVIHGDYKTFCDEVISQFPKKSIWQKIFDFLQTALLIASIMTMIEVVISKEFLTMILDAFGGTFEVARIPFSVSDFLILILIFAVSNLIVNLIIKNSFKPEGKFRVLFGALCGGGFFAAICIIAWIGKEILFYANAFAGIAFAAGCFMVYCLMKRI